MDDLKPIVKSPTGEVEIPPSRLGDATSAELLFNKLDMADNTSGEERAKCDAMYDGEQPYDPAELRAMGRSYQANLNWGEAFADLEASMLAYNDLVLSVPRIADFQTAYGDSVQRGEYSGLISQAYDKFLKAWPSFFHEYQKLTNQFVRHGMGFALFPDRQNPLWCAEGLKSVKLYQGASCNEEDNEVICVKKNLSVHDLWSKVKEMDKATKAGWNYNAVIDALTNACSQDAKPGEWEELQKQLKSNDLTVSYAKSSEIPIAHIYVKEFDGTYTHAMVLQEGGKGEYLYINRGRFTRINQAIVFFPYGIGNDGAAYSIRGQGYKIFPHVQVSNRLRCSMYDGAMLGTSLILQTTTGADLTQMAVTYAGPLALIPGGATVQQTNYPNLAERVLPILGDLTRSRQNNIGGFSARQLSPDGQGGRTAQEVRAQIEKEASITSGGFNIFYASWTKLIREQFARLKRKNWSKDEPGYVQWKVFKDFLDEHKVPWEAVEQVVSVEASRSVGLGSAAQRDLIYQEIGSFVDRLDEAGQVNYFRDRIAARGGYELADRYMPNTGIQRTPIDVKIAELENATMKAGTPVSVQDSENDVIHLSVHLPLGMMIVQAVDQNQADPAQAFALLQTLFPHVAEHFQKIANDPTRAKLLGGFKEAITKLKQATESLGQKMQQAQAQQAQAQQAQAQQAQQAQQPSPEMATAHAKLQMEMEKHQLDMKIKQESAALEMQLKQQQAAADLASKDALTASKISTK